MYRMMIVDDEERIANSIYDLMDERFDFELYRCYSAVAALDVIRTMRFDIVITDIAMPGMSGLELLNKVQAVWPKCHFLILTAYDSFDYAYETLRHDRVDYLLKIESYDTICQCVERKLQDIQKERSREEKLRHYDQYVQQVGESMGRYFLKRIIVQGIPLPDQHDLDQFSVPLRLDQPVMLVFLALNDQNPVTNNRTSMDILQSIQARFQAYDIPFLSYLSTGTILLVIQPGGESNLAGDRITYVQTALENLPQTVEEETGRKLAILCADAPILWQQAHTLYQRAAVRLEDIRSESGMMVLDTAEELRHSDGELFFPSMEELNMLWEMVKCGNIDSFLRVLRDELDTAGNHGSSCRLPSDRSRTAVCAPAGHCCREKAADRLRTFRHAGRLAGCDHQLSETHSSDAGRKSGKPGNVADRPYQPIYRAALPGGPDPDHAGGRGALQPRLSIPLL